MADTENKCSLKNMLKAIVSVANTEQNMFYPPSVFSDQYNTVTSLLLSKCADIYPADNSVLDIIEPFVVRKTLPVKNGYIQFPEDFRNLLGSPMISVTNDGCKECEVQSEITANDFNQNVLKSGCKKVFLLMVDQSEFAFRTTSTYKAPTYDKPIGYRSGKYEIKVCPFDIKSVDVMYVKNEKLVQYGYDMQPDDTFVYNESKSIETEWKSAAFEPIFSALLSLYTAYTRDNNLKDWALYIKQNKLI